MDAGRIGARRFEQCCVGGGEVAIARSVAMPRGPSLRRFWIERTAACPPLAGGEGGALPAACCVYCFQRPAWRRLPLAAPRLEIDPRLRQTLRHRHGERGATPAQQGIAVALFALRRGADWSKQQPIAALRQRLDETCVLALAQCRAQPADRGGQRVVADSAAAPHRGDDLVPGDDAARRGGEQQQQIHQAGLEPRLRAVLGQRTARRIDAPAAKIEGALAGHESSRLLIADGW